MKRPIGYRIILNGEKWWGIKWLCMMTIEGSRGFVAVIGGVQVEGLKALGVLQRKLPGQIKVIVPVWRGNRTGL